MKVLLTSDIHIDDYHKYNPSNEFRLNQFDKLADRIVKIATDNDCEEIWLAGDIINKPVPIPLVIHHAKRFLMKLASVAKVRFIKGQHDQYSKVKSGLYEGSVINLFDEYAEYMHKEVITLDGNTFAFMDYSKKQDLSWLKDPVDVLLGHVSISFGQDWDRSKFKLGFFGDIHKEFVDGNCISIANPIQHRISDQESGSVIILDTKSLKWDRVKVDEGNQFLKMKYTEEGLGYIPDTNTWEVKRTHKATISSATEVIKVADYSFSDLLDEQVESKGLEGIQAEVASKSADYHPINFNFKLKWLKIRNIKGIENFTHEFDGNMMIVGRNGSGKSSFLLGLFQWLTGSMRWDRLQRRGASDGYVEGELEYEGKTFFIKRSKNSNHIKIDKEEIAYKDKRDFNPTVTKHLPFINYYHAFYFNYWVKELLRDENNALKLNIITKFNGLDVFEQYSKVASELIDSTSSNLKKAQKSVDDARVRTELIKSKLSKIKLPEKFNPNKKDQFDEKVETIKSYLDSAELRDKITNLKSEVGDLDLKSSESELKDLQLELAELDSSIDELESVRCSGKSLQSTIESLTKSRDHLISHPDKCTACNSTINPEVNEAKIVELDVRLSQLDIDYAKVRSRFLELNPTKDLTLKARSNKATRIAELKSLIPKLTTLATLIDLNPIIGSESFTAEDLAEARMRRDEYAKNLQMHLEKKGLDEDSKIYKSELKSARSIRDEYKDRLSKLKSYKKLVSKDGVIFESILRELVTKLSNEMFKFSVRSEVVRKVKNIYVSVKYYKESEDTWKDYEDCSQGEKSLCDTYFLFKLLNGSGLIVFDEYYSHVDDDNLPMICDYLNDMEVGCIIISTHSNNMTLDANLLRFPVE